MHNLQEGLNSGDLVRLIEPKLAIDEFRSKMGEDKDIVVVGFTVFGKEPGEDVVNFIEKSYDWVLDADLSSGELSDGNYLVFVELRRDNTAAKKIFSMLQDILHLTKQKMTDWKFTYYNSKDIYQVTEENLYKKIIKTPIEYDKKIEKDTAIDKVVKQAEKNKDKNVEESRELNKLRALANVYVQPVKVTDLPLLALQVVAGIR
jgi:hypothetical protein